MKDKHTVRKSIDLTQTPNLSSRQKARLETLAAIPDESIDYSDAPARPDAEWIKAASRLPGTKQQITLRLDAEVLNFFRETGSRYQSRINAVLRAYVEAQKLQAK